MEKMIYVTLVNDRMIAASDSADVMKVEMHSMIDSAIRDNIDKVTTHGEVRESFRIRSFFIPLQTRK